MTDLAAQLMAKYGGGAVASAAPAASGYAPAAAFTPAGATAPAGNPVGPGAWLSDWNVVPPNIRPDVHKGAFDYARVHVPEKTPKDFYEHAMSQQPGGVFGPDWVADPAVSGNPFELTARAMGAQQAAQPVAVNPPPMAAPAQPAVVSEPPFTEAEIRSLRALLHAVRQLGAQG